MYDVVMFHPVRACFVAQRARERVYLFSVQRVCHYQHGPHNGEGRQALRAHNSYMVSQQYKSWNASRRQMVRRRVVIWRRGEGNSCVVIRADDTARGACTLFCAGWMPLRTIKGIPGMHNIKCSWSLDVSRR